MPKSDADGSVSSTPPTGESASEASQSGPRPDHPQLTAALARLAEADLTASCGWPAPPELLQGIREFNDGQFFEQHETLEELWLRTSGEMRYLYQGILQIGVGLYHLLEKRNYHGATVKLGSGIRMLEPFPPVCQRVKVAQLRDDARRVYRHLLDLGPSRLAEVDRALIPRIYLVAADATAP